MATAIVTDSNCGIAVDEAETLNIHIIPMPILINEISFYEDWIFRILNFYSI